MNRLLLLSILAALIGALGAQAKGRSPFLWAFAGFVFPPALIALLVLPPTLKRGDMKKCPHCAEIIKDDATLCKHCRKDLPLEMIQCTSCSTFVPLADYCSNCNSSLR